MTPLSHFGKQCRELLQMFIANCIWQFWQFYWFQPKGPQDMASAHIKQSKTPANLSYSRPLYTLQHTWDEAIGDVGRNKHFNDLDSYLFIKQKSKTSETLQPVHRKTLQWSIRSAPAQWNISVIPKSVNKHTIA